MRGWSNDMLHREPGNPMPTRRGLESQLKLQRYFDAADRRAPRPPARRHDDGADRGRGRRRDGAREHLSEIRGLLRNLLATAGNETVTKLLASAFYWLWRIPDQRRILVEEPAVIPNAVEEFLRFDPPSQYQGRTATRDVTLHGGSLPKGAKVLLVNGASGRDERRFADPDRLDVRREIEFHLGFGFGRHLCLGAFLARMEIARRARGVPAALARATAIPADGIERMHSSNVRGFSGLVLETS